MPTCPTLLRGPWITPLALAVALMLPTSAGAVATVDQGSIDGAVACSTLDAVDSTCILPFGDVATESTVVTEIAVGDPEPAVAVLRPVEGKPGVLSLTPVSQSANRWRLRNATFSWFSVFDTAIALRPGDQLALVDPLVSTSASSTDFEPTPGPQGPTIDEVTRGELVGVRPVGRIVTEPDADGDGWGDDTQDLCRGVARQHCLPATVKVALSGPEYVPSQQDASWTWQVTNTGDGQQPLVVNVFSNEVEPLVTTSSGNCAPGRIGSVLEAWKVAPSVLSARPVGDGAAPYPQYGRPVGGSGGGAWWHCVLPPLDPGFTASGTVGGRGGTTEFYPLRVEAVVPAVTPATSTASVFVASGKLIHRQAGKPVDAWKAYELLPSSMRTNATWPVSLMCGGPSQATSCTASIIAKAPVGGKILGRATPVSVKPGTKAALSVKFSKAGITWLSTHRKSSVDLVITSTWPGETPAQTTERTQPSLSRAFKKQLDKLTNANAKKPKKKSKKKR